MSAGTYSHPNRSPFEEQSREYPQKGLDDETRERIRQELKYGTPKGDR